MKARAINGTITLTDGTTSNVRKIAAWVMISVGLLTAVIALFAANNVDTEARGKASAVDAIDGMSTAMRTGHVVTSSTASDAWQKAEDTRKTITYVVAGFAGIVALTGVVVLVTTPGLGTNPGGASVVEV